MEVNAAPTHSRRPVKIGPGTLSFAEPWSSHIIIVKSGSDVRRLPLITSNFPQSESCTISRRSLQLVLLEEI